MKQNNQQQPTPETDAAIIRADGAWTFELKETMQRLERERDEALAKLSTVYRWIERNHPDGFIDSQSHLQNLDRVTDAWHDKFEAMREAIREAWVEIQYAEARFAGWALRLAPNDPDTDSVLHKTGEAIRKLQPFLKS